MKNFAQILCVFLLFLGHSYGQQEKGITGTNNWLHGWTEFNPKEIDYGEPSQIIAGNITEDTTLSKRDVYLLTGNVFVTNNATLTIEPGTVIIAAYASSTSLTIAQGSKIIAEGLPTDPIVFTSSRTIRKSGDWGGIIILGDAPTNRFGSGSVAPYYSKLNATTFNNSNYGGDNVAGNSGVLRHVRIEYAGKRIKDAGHFNGLLLAGVGNETVLENIMVSYCQGNAFGVLGGDTHLDKLVSYRTSGNDFEFNIGAAATLTNSLAVRSPYISSSSGSRSVLVKSYDDTEGVDFTRPGTSVVAKNITLITDTDDINTAIQQGLVKEAVYVGHNASLDMSKSVLSGFNPAVLFENKIVVNQENLERIKFTDMYFNNCNGNIFVENNKNNDDLENWYGNPAFLNVYSKSYHTETFIDSKNRRRPDYRLRINEIIASNKVNN